MPTKLPAEDHVVRYVPKVRLRRDEAGNVIGVLPQVFERREDEGYLSATWLEHFCSEYEAGLRAAAAAIRRQLTVKARAGFTVGNVGKIIEICESVNVRVRLLHEKEPENTGHAAIRGIPRDHLELFELLAADAFTDTRIAADVPTLA
jgi:hypothetical protein